MQNKEYCPNCKMQLEDPECCNYCEWTTNTSKDNPEDQETNKINNEEG